MTEPLTYKNPGPSCTCEDYGDPGPSHLPNCPGYRPMTAPTFPKDELEELADDMDVAYRRSTAAALRSAITAYEASETENARLAAIADRLGLVAESWKSRAEEAERKLAEITPIVQSHTKRCGEYGEDTGDDMPAILEIIMPKAATLEET